MASNIFEYIQNSASPGWILNLCTFFQKYWQFCISVVGLYFALIAWLQILPPLHTNNIANHTNTFFLYNFTSTNPTCCLKNKYSSWMFLWKAHLDRCYEDCVKIQRLVNQCPVISVSAEILLHDSHLIEGHATTKLSWYKNVFFSLRRTINMAIDGGSGNKCYIKPCYWQIQVMLVSTTNLVVFVCLWWEGSIWQLTVGQVISLADPGYAC